MMNYIIIFAVVAFVVFLYLMRRLTMPLKKYLYSKTKRLRKLGDKDGFYLVNKEDSFGYVNEKMYMALFDYEKREITYVRSGNSFFAIFSKDHYLTQKIPFDFIKHIKVIKYVEVIYEEIKEFPGKYIDKNIDLYRLALSTQIGDFFIDEVSEKNRMELEKYMKDIKAVLKKK